jgi:hypothetical protein
MKIRRYGLAISALSALGCGGSTTTRLQPAVVDAATNPEVTNDAAQDLDDFANTETFPGSSTDTGNSGSCGSALSFQIVAAAGIDSGSFCTYGCYGVEKIVFTSGSAQVTADDIAYPNCTPLCGACGTTPICHSCSGINPLPPAGVSYDWDGAYWGNGTCGAQACRGPRLCAPPGHYTGEFCAVRGSTDSGRCTPSQGVGSQDVSCSTVEFDLPSTATITVELGP